MPFAYLYMATLVVIMIELVAGRYRGLWTKTNVYSTLASIVGNSMSRPLSTILIAAVIGWALPVYKGSLSQLPLYFTFPAVFMICEFSFYWVHRWSHEAKGGKHNWFWNLHRTHHSGKYINVFVTVRQNVFWSFVVPTPWVLGIATYLGLEMAASLSLVTIYGWNLITHADFRWDDVVRRHPKVGPIFKAIEHVLVSPGIHHTHHGYGRDGGNYRNFAVTLSLFDWMFGTLHIPEGRPWRYGVPGPEPFWAEDVFFPIVRSKSARASSGGDS
jgi:sterol desaturase/sphingolipid hydroxylase (fatty acid hydroxylase superfamily)